MNNLVAKAVGAPCLHQSPLRDPSRAAEPGGAALWGLQIVGPDNSLVEAAEVPLTEAGEMMMAQFPVGPERGWEPLAPGPEDTEPAPGRTGAERLTWEGEVVLTGVAGGTVRP